MSPAPNLLTSIETSANGLTLTELLALHPKIPRRTAQRQISKLIESGHIVAVGNGRTRRYFGVGSQADTLNKDAGADIFPRSIPLSADSQDILDYIDQPPEARRPVGYQRDFLDA